MPLAPPGLWLSTAAMTVLGLSIVSIAAPKAPVAIIGAHMADASHCFTRCIRYKRTIMDRRSCIAVRRTCVGRRR